MPTLALGSFISGTLIDTWLAGQRYGLSGVFSFSGVVVAIVCLFLLFPVLGFEHSPLHDRQTLCFQPSLRLTNHDKLLFSIK